jgi:hypothetical protein
MDIKERIAGEMRSMWLAGSLSICAEPRPDKFYIRAAESIIALFEPVTLEALTDEERLQVNIPCETCHMTPNWAHPSRECMECIVKCHSQATIAKNSGTQLYRIKTEESGNK